MRKCIFLTIAALGISLFIPTPAEAAKGQKRQQRAAARMLGRFDANNDGTLTAKEAERVRRVFTTLKELDSDKNGELSDSEISAAKVTKGKRGGKRGKRNKQ